MKTLACIVAVALLSLPCLAACHGGWCLDLTGVGCDSPGAPQLICPGSETLWACNLDPATYGSLVANIPLPGFDPPPCGLLFCATDAVNAQQLALAKIGQSDNPNLRCNFIGKTRFDGLGAADKLAFDSWGGLCIKDEAKEDCLPIGAACTTELWAMYHDAPDPKPCCDGAVCESFSLDIENDPESGGFCCFGEYGPCKNGVECCSGQCDEGSCACGLDGDPCIHGSGDCCFLDAFGSRTNATCVNGACVWH